MIQKIEASDQKFQEFIMCHKELSAENALTNWNFPLFINETGYPTEYAQSLFKKYLACKDSNIAKEKVRIGHFEYGDLRSGALI